MSLIKLGETHEIKLEDSSSCIPEINAEALDNFRKFANNLKKIAPKAEDFLYFSAVMMHAAEAASLNDDGTPKLTLKAEPVQVGWNKEGGTWKWISNDPNIKPYKNSNGDIFPEEELIKAYKKWKHKPLCIDHKSSSVDHVRGFIVDTYYDRNLKRVIALCALDKAGFPQLARQISTGVSNCVSMGTAVGKAICYDCGRVARAEQDFCNHMKNKSCYGEINVDLNPIELSIVVNGADPKASIKHIIAAADTMNTYLEGRTKELQKIADLNYSATLSVNDPGGHEGGGAATFSVNTTDIEKFKQDLNEAVQKVQEFKNVKNSEKDTNDLAFNQSSGSVAMDESASTDSGLALQTPQNNRFASANLEDDSIMKLQKITASIEEKLGMMKKSLDKLATFTNIKQEENMSGSNELNKKGYYQGAGGVNEPTPGQVKYPKDPLNEQLRSNEDRQMVGQSPFPEVGPVDGMHPSPESADPSNELERKKMLARAEAEEKALRRQSIVQMAKQALESKAYWHGAGGVNEPTPGKVKYPKDKLNEELRDYEDRQMVGQPPFPGVGPVDGLHPSPSSADPKDELKRKEMLARAGLTAKFHKARNTDGSNNLNKSAWEVFLGDKLLLTASVEDLCGGRVTEMLYNNIATKPFGVQLIEKVKAHGADAVSKLIKKAQVPPPAGGTSAPPGDMAGPPAGFQGGDEGTTPVEDAGKSGDPKQNVLELAEKCRDLTSDLVEAVRTLTGEQAEMGGNEAAPVGGVGTPAGGPMAADDQNARKKKKEEEDSSKSASKNFSAYHLNSMRKELNSGLTLAMKESIAQLNGSAEELEMISKLYDKGAVNDASRNFVDSIVEDALNDAKAALTDGWKLATAYVKYASGTQAIVKRAEMEAEYKLLAEGDSMSDEKDDDSQSADGADLMGLINDTNADLDAVHNMMGDEELGHEHSHEHEGELGDLELDGLLEEHGNHEDEDLERLTADDNDGVNVENTNQANEILKQNPQADVTVGKMASFSTKAGRALLRNKLAADATGKQEDGEVEDVTKLKFSDMLDQADGLADGQTHLDVKPSASPGPSAKFPLGLVETPEESLKAMLEVAKAPPKVRKDAAWIQKLVSEGKIDAQDVDALVAHGLDKETVAYWKKYYSEVDGGNEFASELVKEHVKANFEEELNKFRVKMARAYELTYDMVERNLCRNDRSTISKQVDAIMKFNDDNFEELKRVIAKGPIVGMRKAAGLVPQVGFSDDDTVSSNMNNLTTEDEYTQLSSMFGTKKGIF